MFFRVGHGYDAHRLAFGCKFILGGVEIPYHIGILGHSDADVLTHAIIDSLFGAAGLKSIGENFPDKDMKYKNISSLILLKRTADILYENNFEIMNIDSTIVLEKPKIKDAIPRMRENISRACNINIEQINTKATTEEGLGFSGKGLGISSYAICIIKNKN